MAGELVRILPRTDFDMTGLSGGTAVDVAVRKFDSSEWREGVALVRLHAVTWSAGMSISLVLAPDGATDEDPAAIWSFASTTLLTFTQGTDSAPAIKIAAFAIPFGPLAELQLKFTVGAPAAFRPSLSVDLNLKGA